MNQNVKRMVYGGLLIAIGVVLPQAFHIFGQSAGQTFLPMHIPVILAGMLIGPLWGAGVAVIVPILSSLITGMPPVPMLYFMIFELLAYAVVSGLLAKRRLNTYLNLAITIVCGRAVYGLSLVVAVQIFSFAPPFANMTGFLTGLVSGLPVVILQFVAIPFIMMALKKGGLVLVKAK